MVLTRTTGGAEVGRAFGWASRCFSQLTHFRWPQEGCSHFSFTTASQEEQKTRPSQPFKQRV